VTCLFNDIDVAVVQDINSHDQHKRLDN